MPWDATQAAPPEREIMASVDSDDGQDRFIIADVCSDEAWMSAPLESTITVREWL